MVLVDDADAATARATLAAAASASPTFTGAVTLAAGSVSSPALTFTGDTNTGLYAVGADQVGVTAGGGLVATFKTTGPEFAGAVTLAAGSVSSPSLTFTGDANTGLYAVGADQVGVTAGGGLVATFKTTGPDLASGKVLSIAATQVVGARVTGWTAATGTATRTTFVTSTVTLEQLAQRVKALLDDLIAHGLIGT